MEESDEILGKIDQLRNKYYSQNEKKFFFKKKQKLECANTIVQNFNIDTLIGSTVFVIPNTNHIYFNYPLFKTYAASSLYNSIIDHTLGIVNICIDTYGAFEMHVNLNTFSISAVERYHDAIRLFCDECLKNNKDYYKKNFSQTYSNVKKDFEKSCFKCMKPLGFIVLNKGFICH